MLAGKFIPLNSWEAAKSFVVSVAAALVAVLKSEKDFVETDFEKKGYPSEHPLRYKGIVIAYNSALAISAAIAVVLVFYPNK